MKQQKNRRRRIVLPPGAITHFPTESGWWVQWSGRKDWHPMTPAAGEFMQKVIAGEGDRLVKIEAKQ